ncbi:MAG: hypothetical protein HYZ15_08990 [Sphingobacteriales bacterium]|nr:hypothetical protein [Sphingobacteriales bacterium]
MYESLYQYLIQHKQLPVTGIGTFWVDRKPATVNFPEKRMEAPSFAIRLQPAGNLPGKSFFSWLGAALRVSERDAVIRYNDFAFDLKKDISQGTTVEWKGVGTLSKGLAGDIKFVPVEEKSIEAAVPAEKIVRDKAAHKVRVGEEERTSEEMTAYFNQTGDRKNYWWTGALVAGVLSVIFIGWYFSENGVGMAATANTKKLVPAEAGLTYRLLP